MTSASTTHAPLSAEISDAGPRVPLRLTLKPTAPTTGFVDGGWWPRSRDLAAELPALLEVLSNRLGRIERVSYHLTEWASPPRKTSIASRVVRLAGDHSQRAHTIDVLAEHHHVTLLVIPPETPAHSAQHALTHAGQPGDRHTPAELLADANAHDQPNETARAGPELN